MALPTNWGTGTVQGKYIKMDGSADSGTVSFIPNATRITNASDQVIILPTTLVATLDVNGAISIALPATNDTDTNPLGFTYTVVENLTSGLGKTYPIAVPVGVTTYLYSAVAIDPATGLYVPGTPAPSAEVFFQTVSADITGIVIDTINLDGVTGLTGAVVPDYAVPVYLEAQVTFSHSVVSASVAVGIALSSATIVTGLLDAKFACCTVIGNKASARAFVKLPAHSPGTYSTFVVGDAGTLTVKAASYYKSFFWGYT